MATADKLTTVDFSALQTDPGYMLDLYFAQLRNSHAGRSVGKGITCVPLNFYERSRRFAVVAAAALAVGEARNFAARNTD